MRCLIALVVIASIQTACVKAPEPKPELDAVKVQEAIYNLGAHVIAIEKKLGIVYPTATPEAKK